MCTSAHISVEERSLTSEMHLLQQNQTPEQMTYIGILAFLCLVHKSDYRFLLNIIIKLPMKQSI